MSLHPILALDHVIAEYRDYLHSEFRAKDGETGFRSQDSGFRGYCRRPRSLRPAAKATGSGKTEVFLLPVIPNALQDAMWIERSGLRSSSSCRERAMPDRKAFAAEVEVGTCPDRAVRGRS